jgi:hypothetical protein
LGQAGPGSHQGTTRSRPFHSHTHTHTRTAIDSGSREQPPTLAHGLEAVLFQPGKVIRLQDPVTRKFNFSPSLQHLHTPDKFNFGRLRPHIPPAADPTLRALAHSHHLPYMSSTSSFTELLAKLYLLMCRGRPVDVSHLSPVLEGADGTKAMSKTNYKPVSCLMHWRGTGYAINKERFFADLKGTVMSYMVGLLCDVCCCPSFIGCTQTRIPTTRPHRANRWKRCWWRSRATLQSTCSRTRALLT